MTWQRACESHQSRSDMEDRSARGIALRLRRRYARITPGTITSQGDVATPGDVAAHGQRDGARRSAVRRRAAADRRPKADQPGAPGNEAANPPRSTRSISKPSRNEVKWPRTIRSSPATGCIVGRNEVVKKTVEIDRLNAPIQSITGMMLAGSVHASSSTARERRPPR